MHKNALFLLKNCKNLPTREGTGRNSPLTVTSHKGHFCKSSKTDEKILGVWGDDVTNHSWISTWVCHKRFSKTGSNLYFI